MELSNHFWGQPSPRNELLAVVLWTPGFYTHLNTWPQLCFLSYGSLLLTQLTGWGRTGRWRRKNEGSVGRIFIWLSGVLNKQFVSICNVEPNFEKKKYYCSFLRLFFYYFCHLIIRGSCMYMHMKTKGEVPTSQNWNCRQLWADWCGGWDLNLNSLKKRCTFLTDGPCIQPCWRLFKKCSWCFHWLK